MSTNLKKSIFKLITPEKVMHNKKSVISSIIDTPLEYLFSKLDGKMIDVDIDTSKNFAAEKLKYKVVARDLKRTEEKIAKNRETRVTRIIPVSYTHLDVYKRQGLCWYPENQSFSRWCFRTSFICGRLSQLPLLFGLLL